MKTTNEIIQHFHSKATLFSLIQQFSDKLGIYAVHFMGNAFPVYTLKPVDNEIIYIGKTEKSQASRDANTHFATGKSGSSTLRRSVGALMMKGAKLKPIPRSTSETSEKRFTNYMFDEPSEKLITEWMTKNLGLSFYEFTGTTMELDQLETTLIKALKPMLNIDPKNSENPHYQTIRNLRAECAQKAKENEFYKPIPSEQRPQPTVQPSQKSGNAKGLYLDIWAEILPIAKEKLEKGEDFTVQFKEHVFDTVGSRKKYSFRLELYNGIAQNNLGGSAVARDLYATLSDSKVISKLLLNKRVVFRLSKDFVFGMNYVIT